MLQPSDTSKKSKCIHCGVEIKHVLGRIWSDGMLIFAQYCVTTPQNNGDQLHEPDPKDVSES